jgi:hypothetical protein
LKKFLNKFSEAWIQAFVSCCTMMVQGDFLSLSLKHAFVASKTASITGIATGLFLVKFNKNMSPFIVAWIVGLFTSISDYIVHPTHFGDFFYEALATGIMAGFLAYAYERLKK